MHDSVSDWATVLIATLIIYLPVILAILKSRLPRGTRIQRAIVAIITVSWWLSLVPAGAIALALLLDVGRLLLEPLSYADLGWSRTEFLVFLGAASVAIFVSLARPHLRTIPRDGKAMAALVETARWSGFLVATVMGVKWIFA